MYLWLVGRLTPCFSCFSFFYCFYCFKLVGGCVAAGDDVVFRWMMVKWLWSSGDGQVVMVKWCWWEGWGDDERI